MSTQLLKVPQVASRLGCGRTHVYELIATGALPSVNIAAPSSPRPQTRVRETDLDRFIDQRTRSARALRAVGS